MNSLQKAQFIRFLREIAWASSFRPLQNNSGESTNRASLLRNLSTLDRGQRSGPGRTRQARRKCYLTSCSCHPDLAIRQTTQQPSTQRRCAHRPTPHRLLYSRTLSLRKKVNVGFGLLGRTNLSLRSETIFGRSMFVIARPECVVGRRRAGGRRSHVALVQHHIAAAFHRARMPHHHYIGLQPLQPQTGDGTCSSGFAQLHRLSP